MAVFILCWNLYVDKTCLHTCKNENRSLCENFTVFTDKVPNFLVCFLQANQLNVRMLLERVEALEAKQKLSIADMKKSIVQHALTQSPDLTNTKC